MSYQEQPNAIKFRGKLVHPYNHGNNKLHSMTGEKFLENNQPQQPNERQNLQNQTDKTIAKIQLETASINLRHINNHLCFEQNDKNTGGKLVGLIDSTIGQNYILNERTKLGRKLKLRNPFFIQTIHGQIEISYFVRVNLFSHVINFFLIDYLNGFDLVLGTNGLQTV